MEFRDLYKKYLAGECTDEEKKFVESEIEKAKIVSDELFKDRGSVDLKEVTDEEVLRAKKKFNIKTIIKTAVISFVSFVLLVGITVGVIFGLAINGAKSNIKYNDQQSQQAVKEFVYNNALEMYEIENITPEMIYVKEEEKELQIQSPPHRSYYIIEYEIIVKGYEFEVELNSRTGDMIITDVDREW